MTEPAKRLLDFWRSARASVEARPELEQAGLRVALVGIVLVYLILASLRDGRIEGDERQVVLVAAGTFVFALLLLLHIAIARDVSIVRRFVGMFADNAVTTYCLIQMDEVGAVIIGVYLFVTFGNGFRYGRFYLHACQVMSVAGFLLVVALSGYWRTHVPLAVGVLIGMVVLPFYVGVLTTRITEAKRRADHANQAKGRFLANVSHEMRTPLNGVIAMADVLRETSLSEGQREIVETMTTSAHLLLAQIEDVLDMAKIEAGRVQIELRPFDLGKLISNTVKVVVPQARYKGLALNTDVAAAAAGWFMGDAHHLRQVILNLLSNAIKFTEKGEVVLRARALAGGEGRTLLRIEVQDTGIGIAADKQALIFEPFQQADDSVTRIYGGTGLGTTIAKQLVTQMGGTIGLVSAPGAGSTFWIELPLAATEARGLDFTEEPGVAYRANARVLSAGGANVKKIRGARILVAEDNPTNQRVAQLILESGNHSVTIAANGEEALDHLERGGFDLALFDLSMPVVSGLEALKLYLFATPTPVPVLILSANVTTDVIAECMRAGAAEFVPKPLRASILLDAVNRHLAAAELHQPAAVPPPPRVEERPQLAVVDNPVLDAEVLTDLERLSTDPTFVDRLIVGFRGDAERLLSEIVDAFAKRNYEAVKDAAHALKGGAGSVGAVQLMQLASRLDKATHEALRTRAAQHCDDLRRTANEALNALDAYLEKRRAARGGSGARSS